MTFSREVSSVCATFLFSVGASVVDMERTGERCTMPDGTNASTDANVAIEAAATAKENFIFVALSVFDDALSIVSDNRETLMGFGFAACPTHMCQRRRSRLQEERNDDVCSKLQLAFHVKRTRVCMWSGYRIPLLQAPK